MDQLPKEIRQRCQFLWSSAMQCADASPPQPRTAQKLLHSLRQLTAAHDCRVPDSLTKTLCPKCWAPRIPGVSCRTRTAKRTRRSPASMRYVPGKTGGKSGGHALKSQLVTTCLLCGAIARAPGAPRPPARPPKKRDMRAAADDFVAVGAPLLPARAPKRPPPPAPAQPRKLLDAKPRKRKKTDKKPK